MPVGNCRTHTPIERRLHRHEVLAGERRRMHPARQYGPRNSQRHDGPTAFTCAGGLAFTHRRATRVQNGEGVTQAVVEAHSDRAIGLMWMKLRPHVGGLGYCRAGSGGFSAAWSRSPTHVMDLDLTGSPSDARDRADRREWVGRALPRNRHAPRDQLCLFRVRLGSEPAQFVDVRELDHNRPPENAPVIRFGDRRTVHREDLESSGGQRPLHAVSGPDQPCQLLERVSSGLHIGFRNRFLDVQAGSEPDCQGVFLDSQRGFAEGLRVDDGDLGGDGPNPCFPVPPTLWPPGTGQLAVGHIEQAGLVDVHHDKPMPAYLTSTIYRVELRRRPRIVGEVSTSGHAGDRPVSPDGEPLSAFVPDGVWGPRAEIVDEIAESVRAGSRLWRFDVTVEALGDLVLLLLS